MVREDGNTQTQATGAQGTRIVTKVTVALDCDIGACDGTQGNYRMSEFAQAAVLTLLPQVRAEHAHQRIRIPT